MAALTQIEKNDSLMLSVSNKVYSPYVNEGSRTYRFPMIVRESPTDGVDRSYFVAETPNKMQTTIN
jgi:hypothetical protein